MSNQSGAGAGRRTNRLAAQTSPYLLQHAHNPVDWWPWGAEAFEEARRRDVPIFLSVGYSTCYWCHVMERESFEDEATARQMNERFVCIKVDREERPDVDDLYMAATQAFTGRGGWPMSVFLEPKGLRPFWAGTYFPVEPRYGMPGFRQVLGSVATAWAEQREQALAQADALAGAVAEHLGARSAPVALGADQVAGAVGTLMRIHDRAHGGFGQGGPKFPQPSYIDLLLEFRRVAGDEETRRAVDAAVRTTLDKMACGGMHDQVGGGFHRYSVDEKWVVPHFEKMLYDNGQLCETYGAAASVYGDAFYARVAARTAGYVLREMASPEGAFFSAQDAEVNHREGQNYLWTRAQLVGVLGEEDGAFAARVYGVDQGENFRDPHHPHEPASNVLFLTARPEHLAAQLNLSVEAFIERLDGINDRLYGARLGRDQPHRDDKVLAGWNGMMIAGLSVASVVLGEACFADAARRAADFILARMRDGRDGLLRSFGGAAEGGAAPRAHIPAFLDDYAAVVHGLIGLHRALGAQGQGADTYLAAARELAADAEVRFGDTGAGGFFDTREGQADLFLRGRSTYDGAVPSGVSMMLNNLIDLYEETGDEGYLDRAAAGLNAVSAAVAESPVATVNSTRALLRMLVTGPGELRIRGQAAGAPAPNGAAGASQASDAAQPLEVYASTDRVILKADEPAGFVLELALAAGTHVLAAEPLGDGGASAGLIGLRLDIINGGGVAVYADWPEGEAYGADGSLRAYTGRISVPVMLERTGEWSGRPLLALRYQVCTETECLPPGTVELAVALDRA